jgi:sortase A
MRRLHLLGNVLVAASVLLLAGPAERFVTGLRAQAKGVSPPAAPSSSAARPVRRPADGEALGRLELSRLGLDLVVFEGISDATLQKGPGHLPGTPWPGGPGEGGNCVIAGHRDSFFRKLADARKNDLVRVHGPSGISTYRLGERRIVRPEDVSAVAPTSDARLTLITCYPFSWTGSAPYRLVWNAVRLEPAPPGESLQVSQRRSR